VLRAIFGLEEVTGGWRKLHEELHIWYSLSNTDDEMLPRITRRVGVAGSEKIGN
jgi:hypothetical protein